MLYRSHRVGPISKLGATLDDKNNKYFPLDIKKILLRLYHGRHLNHEVRKLLSDKSKSTNIYFPMRGDKKPINLEYFNTDEFQKEFGTQKFILILKELGETKINEIKESCNDEKIHVDEIDFDNDEAIYCNDNLDWLIYFSHENSITIFGNDLVKKLKSNWPTWDKFSDPWRQHF